MNFKIIENLTKKKKERKIGSIYVDRRTEGREGAGMEGRRAQAWADCVLLPERS